MRIMPRAICCSHSDDFVHMYPTSTAHVAVGAGAYLTPREFHRVIEEALEADKADSVVLIDVRNIYETRIGRFDIAEESESKLMTIDPETRSVRSINYTFGSTSHSDSEYVCSSRSSRSLQKT